MSDEPMIPVIDQPAFQPRRIHRQKAALHTAAPAQTAAAPRMHEPDRQEPMERAAPVREDESEPVTRRSREDRDVNRFSIPRRYIKPGWDLEWKTIRVMNDPVSTSDLLDIHEAGWRAEKARDWPKFVPEGTPPDAPIEIDGQRLFGRPKQFTLDAKAEDERIAQRQMRDRMQASQEGRLVGGRGEEGLADMAGIRSVPLGVSVDGEVGVGERVLRR